MKKIQSILLVTPDYPYQEQYVFTFVKNLSDEFARKGCKVTVISPQSVTSSFRYKKTIRPIEWTYRIDDKEVKVYQPYRLTFPHKYHDINNFLTRLCLYFFFRQHPLTADVCYCHFWNSAYAVLPYVMKRSIPLFVATGESDISYIFTTRFDIRELRDYVKGVVCVSSKNRDESIKLGLTIENKCEIFPNAVDEGLFYKRNQKECRARLGVPEHEFVVAFVGWFIDRKGPQRVAAAISKVDGVKSIFIGKGEQDPQCKGILFKGDLSHEVVPLYLGAADVFVLPTQHEGCCNAVIEAMACGLPVISSNLPFNWDVLDESNSILVDPNNIDEIASAIKILRNDKARRNELAEGALRKAEDLTIGKRAEAILDFVARRLNTL